MVLRSFLKKIPSDLRQISFFTVSFLVILCFAAVLFYKTNLRHDFELRFSHAKVKFANSFFPEPSNLYLVEIDEPSVEALGTKTSGDRKELGFNILRQAVVKILGQRPASLTVLLPTQVFLPSDPKRLEFFSLLDKYPNLSITTFDNPYEKFPFEYSGRVWSGDLHPEIQNKTQNRGRFPLLSMNADHLGTISSQLAMKINSDLSTSDLSFVDGCCDYRYEQTSFFRPKLNFSFERKSLVDVLAESAKSSIENRHVMLGYSAFRTYTFRYNHATRINLLQDKIFGPLVDGTSLMKAHANSAWSLATGNWLRSPPFIVLVMTVLVTISFVFFFAFFFSALNFMLLSILFYFGLFCISVCCYIVFSIELPVVDSIFWASALSFMGLQLQFRTKQKEYLKEKSFSNAIQGVNQVQNQFFEKFSSQVHDINKSILHDVQEIRFGAETERVHIFIQEFVSSSDQLQHYLHSILELNDLKGSELVTSYEREEVNISTFIDKIFEAFSVGIRAKKVTFKNETDGQKVLLNQPVVTQILINIASNAVKYVDEAGSIRARYYRKQGSHMIEVWNSGVRISEDEIENIFEKYYRIKDDNVYKQEGTGLGLYLVKFLADLIGAKIHVESSEKNGTSFIVEWQ